MGKSSAELSAVNLDANLKQFKRFNAKRKFRAAVKTIMAVGKMQLLMAGARAAAGGGGLTANPIADHH